MQGLGRELFELPVAACHGVRKWRDKVPRSVIANDRDGTTSGRWDGRQLTGQIDPTRALRVRAWERLFMPLRRYSARTAAPAWLEIGMPCQNNERGGQEPHGVGRHRCWVVSQFGL
jgi:hypothetical protein